MSSVFVWLILGLVPSLHLKTTTRPVNFDFPPYLPPLSPRRARRTNFLSLMTLPALFRLLSTLHILPPFCSLPHPNRNNAETITPFFSSSTPLWPSSPRNLGS